MSSSRTADRRRRAPPKARTVRLRTLPRRSAALAALTAANPDDDGADVAAFASAGQPSIETALPGLLLDDAIPLRLRRRLDRGDPVCVSITVPGPSWCDPICAAVNSRFPKASRTARDGSSRAEHAHGKGNATVAEKLRAGRPVVGISHAPARFLPAALLSAADAHVTIAAPTGRQMRKLLKLCVGGATPRAIADNCAAGLDFEEILAAFRGGASARAVVDHLNRARGSKTRLNPDDDTPPLDSLAGYGEAKDWGLALAGGIAAWRRREIAWSALSAAAVLHGPPGTGKTLFARSLAKTLGVPIVATSVGDWFATTSGHLDSMTRGAQAAWDSARALAPAILFIDELDSIPDRRTLSDRNRDWWTPLVNFILTLFDGAQTSRDGIILLGATNYPDRLDPALIRPGRFDRLIAVPPPTTEGLAAILRHHLGADLVGADLTAVARLRPGATGADAGGWVRDARAAARQAGRGLTFDDLIKTVMPPETRPTAQVARIARHEAAHAVVGHALGAQTIDAVSLTTPGVDGAAH
ncbi:MAG: ATP-binding protein, partial [Roseiarcus sp.]